MKQHEAVIKVMEENGGFATLGFLYQEALNVPGVEWGTKTPFASVRRIVQDDRFFFKIKPGLWALKDYKNKLPAEIFPTEKIVPAKKAEFDHAYYQGLLVEIGNLKNLQTTVPPQDKNKKYLSSTLGNIATAKKFYPFSYDRLIKKAQTVDVVWFNKRKMPDSFFEVEHSTNIQNSLLKFVELQDFYAKFYIAADKVRKRSFESKMVYDAFSVLVDRVGLISYDDLSDWHAKTYEAVALESRLNL
jgi:hypothetical protein